MCDKEHLHCRLSADVFQIVTYYNSREEIMEFIDKLDEINLDDLDAHQQHYLEDLISFLLNWLSVHILHMDKKIGEFVANLK